MHSTLAALLLTAAYAAWANPPKLAEQARLDLRADTSVAVLTNGFITAGNGTLDRMIWEPDEDQPGTYYARWSIHRFAWRGVGLQFTPANSGQVTLRLMGPWEEYEPGTIYRQEVFWDAGSAQGATLSNASFEAQTAGIPDGWTLPWSSDPVVTNGPPAPYDGTNYVSAWHNGPLETSLTVTGNVPVSLFFQARALIPTNFTEMPRILTTNTPAHRAALNFMRGVNLAGHLEAPPSQDWGGACDTNDFLYVREAGFDHVRLPIAWHYYTGPGPAFTLSNQIVEAADFLVTNSLNNGLAVLIDIHHFDDFTTDPPAHSNKLFKIWTQIAEHYSNFPDTVAFEILNEPKDAATTELMNGIYAELIPVIRRSNPARTIFVGPGAWNGIGELGNLVLPGSDSNLIVTVHSYAPFLFTHQGASWTLPTTATTNVVYPGPPAVPLTPDPACTGDLSTVNWFAAYNTVPEPYNPSGSNAFVAGIEYARDWSEHFGRPVHVGEFGCYTRAPHNSRVRFYHEMRAALDQARLGWAMWDWKTGFNYWDPDLEQPVPGMTNAMFPEIVLQWSPDRAVLAAGAKGKLYILDETLALTGAVAWNAVASQQLDSAEFEHQPHPTNGPPEAFYRLRWLK